MNMVYIKPNTQGRLLMVGNAENVLLKRKQEMLLKDFVNAGIGVFTILEETIRFQAARLYIRWYELVIKGEDDASPEALALKHQIETVLSRIQTTKSSVENWLSHKHQND